LHLSSATGGLLNTSKLVPRPQCLEQRHGAAVVNSSWTLTMDPADPAAAFAVSWLSTQLEARFNLQLQIAKGGVITPHTIFIGVPSRTEPLQQLCSQRRIHPPSTAEGYSLDVAPDMIIVAGRDDSGAFYGGATVLQLFGAVSTSAASQVAVRLPSLRILDYPDQPLRGLWGYGNSVWGDDLQTVGPLAEQRLQLLDLAAESKLNYELWVSDAFFRAAHDPATAANLSWWHEALAARRMQLVADLADDSQGPGELDLNVIDGLWVRECITCPLCAALIPCDPGVAGRERVFHFW